jgi:hypothetical protein
MKKNSTQTVSITSKTKKNGLVSPKSLTIRKTLKDRLIKSPRLLLFKTYEKKEYRKMKNIMKKKGRMGKLKNKSEKLYCGEKLRIKYKNKKKLKTKRAKSDNGLFCLFILK